ncbi:hypothetical protein ACMFMF_007944 [Clarireedia jacksonii]
MAGILDVIGIGDKKGGRAERKKSQSTRSARRASASDAVKTRVELELEDAISELEEQRKLEVLSAQASEVTIKSKLNKSSALVMLRTILARPKSEPTTKKDKNRTSPPNIATKRLNNNSVHRSGQWGRIGPMQSPEMTKTPRPIDIPSRGNKSIITCDSQSLEGQYIKELNPHPYMKGDQEYENGEEDTNMAAFYRHKIALSAPLTQSDKDFEEERSTCAGSAMPPSRKTHDAVAGFSRVFYVDPSNVHDILAKRDFLVSGSLPHGIGRSRSLGPAAQSPLIRTRSQGPSQVHESLPRLGGEGGRSSTTTTFSMFMPSCARGHEEDNPMPKIDQIALQSVQPSPTRQANENSTRHNINKDILSVPPLSFFPQEYGCAITDIPLASTHATQDQDWTSTSAIESTDQHGSRQSYHAQRTWADILATDDIPVSPETIKYDCYATYSPVSPLDRGYEFDQWAGSQEILICYSPDNVSIIDSLQSRRRFSSESKSIPGRGQHNETTNIVSDLRSRPPVFPSSLPVTQHGFLPQLPLDDNESSFRHNLPLLTQYTSSSKSQNSQRTTPPSFPRPNTLLAAQETLETCSQRQSQPQNAQTLPNTCYTPLEPDAARLNIILPPKKSPSRPNLLQPSPTSPVFSNIAQARLPGVSRSDIRPLKVQKAEVDPFEVEEERWREAVARLKWKRDGRGGDENSS